MSSTNGNGRDYDDFINREFQQNGTNSVDLGTVARQAAAEAMDQRPGNFIVPHVHTFAGIQSTASKVYLPSDEALRNSRDNAIYMRNDCGIMECLETRQRAVALLDWQVVPEDDRSHEQQQLCEELTKIMRKIRRFTEYRRCLLEALWYGRYAVQNAYGKQRVGSKMRHMPTAHKRNTYGWEPLSGDKLVFRYDDGRGVHDPGQMGIRVSQTRWGAGDIISDRHKVEATSQGLAYFLSDLERQKVVVHKHTIEDAPWEQSYTSGSIHGVGIRSRIYWDWMQKQELLGFLIEYLERSAGGIEIWPYPSGNAQAKADVESAIKERSSHGRNALLVPTMPGEDAPYFIPQIIEPGMAGIEAVQGVLNEYYGHRIKRYILGQTLSTEAAATGLGSGLAELHMDSFMMIVKYDALNLEETITHELLNVIKEQCFPAARGIDVEFKLVLDDPNIEEKLSGWEKAWNMGLRIPEQDLAETVGSRIPDENDRVLENPQLQQAAMMAGQGGGMFGGPGPQGADSGGVEFNTGSDLGDVANDAMMQAMFGEPSEGATVTYAAEGGKWVQRELPFQDADRGDVVKYGKDWKEEEHPRDESGQFTEGEGNGKEDSANRSNLDPNDFEQDVKFLEKEFGAKDLRFREAGGLVYATGVNADGERVTFVQEDDISTIKLSGGWYTHEEDINPPGTTEDEWTVFNGPFRTEKAAQKSARESNWYYADNDPFQMADGYESPEAKAWRNAPQELTDPDILKMRIRSDDGKYIDGEINGTPVAYRDNQDGTYTKVKFGETTFPAQKRRFSRRNRAQQVNRMSRRFSDEGKVLFSMAIYESKRGQPMRYALRESQRMATGRAKREIQSVINTLYEV